MNNLDFSKIYSFSKLNLFDTCKKQYHFNYLDPEVAPRKKEFIKPRDYMTKGSAVHDAITLFYHLSVEERTFPNLKKCLKESWYSEDDKYKSPPLGELGGFKDLEHERKTYREALHLLKNFYDMEDIDPNLFLIPTKNIKYSFDDYKKMIQGIGDDVSISGKFDRIDKLDDGKLRIIDFKTGKKKEDNFQLEFYKYLAELNFDSKVKTVSFYYLNTGEVEDFDFSDVKNDDVQSKIIDKVKAITDEKDFPPEPSALCNFCDFKVICPHFENK